VNAPLPDVPRSDQQGPAKSRRRRRQDELIASDPLQSLRKPSSASGAVAIMLGVLAVMWLIVIVNAFLDHRLLRFGIKPREVDGLPGVVLSPFLHANAGHLLANTLPFAVLGWLMLISGLRYFTIVTLSVVVVAGLIDWATGPSGTVIVGASGIIFGWLGYLLGRAWFGRQLKWIAIAVAVAAGFSSMFAGLLPKLHSNVFWGGHVAGFLVGVLIAAILHRRSAAARASGSGSRASAG
jgi:membrane associated rhomboid family serine protease